MNVYIFGVEVSKSVLTHKLENPPGSPNDISKQVVLTPHGIPIFFFRVLHVPTMVKKRYVQSLSKWLRLETFGELSM